MPPTLALSAALACAARVSDEGDKDGADSAVEESAEAESGAGDSVPESAPCESPVRWFQDADGDGFGDLAEAVDACEAPDGFVANADDCDDAHAEAFRGADERLTDGVDDDCDGEAAASSISEVGPWSVVSDRPSGWYGYSLDTIANVDGTSALLMAAMSVDLAGESRWGAAAIFAGPLERDDAGLGLSAAQAVLYAAHGDYAVFACAVGDIDGDSETDIALGGPSEANNNSAGVAYLARGPFHGDVDLTTTAHRFEGDTLGQGLGACAGPGDLDGDGLADVVLTAPEYRGGGDGHGAVYVFRGPVAQTSIYDADTILQGEAFHEWLGYSVTALGDLDGDGAPDYGVTNYNSAGKDGLAAYLVTDHVGGVMHPRDVGVTVQYDKGGGYLADTLQLNDVGDLTGDGYTDVAIGVDSIAPSGESDVLTVLAGPFGAQPRLDDATEWLIAYYSTEGGPTRWLTWATGLGDWDGDGGTDLAIGDAAFATDEVLADPGFDCVEDGACRFGATYLLAGPFETGAVDLAHVADRVEGEQYGGQLGRALAGGADLDGDGFPDLAIGAPFVSETENNQGATYVIFGGGVP